MKGYLNLETCSILAKTFKNLMVKDLVIYSDHYIAYGTMGKRICEGDQGIDPENMATMANLLQDIGGIYVTTDTWTNEPSATSYIKIMRL